MSLARRSWVNEPDATSPEQALAERVREEYSGLPTGHEHVRAWERDVCRTCGASGLHEILSLGDLPPANAYATSAELGSRSHDFPLSLAALRALRHGAARPCRVTGRLALPVLPLLHVQFGTDGRTLLPSDDRERSEFVRPGGLVVEIGSNDGTALAAVDARDVRVLGVDPSRNISVMAAARGVPTIAEFFTETLAEEIVRVAVAQN